MIGKGLPYDAEIEYLQCTGTQRIDTDIRLVSGTTLVECVFNVLVPAKISRSQAIAISMPNAGLQVYVPPTTTITFYVNQGIGLKASPYVKYLIETQTTATSRKIRINGGSWATQQFNRSITDNSPIYLLNNDAFSMGISCNIYDFQIKLNGIIVRDFIPVRKGQTGYLYDKVSGELFGNAGTGSFIVGPDRVNP